MTDQELQRPIRTWDSGVMPLARVLHGVAAHAAYHAGQARLIRTLLGAAPPRVTRAAPRE